MADAALVRVAEAIASEIGSTTFEGAKLKPIRSYADWAELLEAEDGTDLRCDVVPVGHASSELYSRGTVQYRCPVDVGLRKRLAASDRDSQGRLRTETLDRLVRLVELLTEYFIYAGNGRRLADYPAAAWVETDIRQTYVRKHLREAPGQFTAIIRMTYDVPA